MRGPAQTFTLDERFLVCDCPAITAQAQALGKDADSGTGTGQAAASAAPFRVRAMRPEDRPFVCTAWLQSYRTSAFATLLGDAYRRIQGGIINRLIASPRVIVMVACDSADENLLFGFVAAEADCLHYVFTRRDVRGEGIAYRLLRCALEDALYGGAKLPVCSAPFVNLNWQPQRAWV